MSKIGLIVALMLMTMTVSAQSNAPIDAPKKANARAGTTEAPAAPEPFDGASVEKLGAQCVTLDTELGAIDSGVLPKTPPRAVPNFLTPPATGAFDTTTFSRVVKGFVIQGGNLQTSEKWSAELAKRMTRRLHD